MRLRGRRTEQPTGRRRRSRPPSRVNKVPASAATPGASTSPGVLGQDTPQPGASPRSDITGLTPREELALYRQAANGDYQVGPGQRLFAVKFTSTHIATNDVKTSN